jgi:hypothetical protein
MLSFNNIFLIVIVNEPIEGSDTSFEERNLIFSRMKANLEFGQNSNHKVIKKKSKYTYHLEEKYVVEAQKKDKFLKPNVTHTHTHTHNTHTHTCARTQRSGTLSLF